VPLHQQPEFGSNSDRGGLLVTAEASANGGAGPTSIAGRQRPPGGCRIPYRCTLAVSRALTVNTTSPPGRTSVLGGTQPETDGRLLRPARPRFSRSVSGRW